jgi:tetratricopeptide (TPR) repeat protein
MQVAEVKNGGGSVSAQATDICIPADERPSKDAWFKSEPYQQLMAATRQDDVIRQTQIIEGCISASAGADQAFWLLIRCGMRNGAAVSAPSLRERAWADLEEAFRIAPDDHRIREHVLFSSLGLCIGTEKLGRMMPFVRALRRDIVEPKDGAFFNYNLGILHLRRGRWQAAYRALCRAETGMLSLSPDAQAACRDQLGLLYMKRTVAALACDRPDVAAGDLAAATAIYAAMQYKFSGVFIAIARAELALYQGQFQQARASLQLGLVQDRTRDYAKLAPSVQTDVELLTARIARAEGNQESFTHFCGRALAIAQQQDLSISLARVRAVMAGARR